MPSEVPKYGWTLGFALAKGLIKGRFSRYPQNPSSSILVCYHFWMDVRESVQCLSVDTFNDAPDSVQMGVSWARIKPKTVVTQGIPRQAGTDLGPEIHAVVKSDPLVPSD